MTQTTATSSVPAFTFATYTGSVSLKSGVTITAGDTISVALSETLPAGTVIPPSATGLFSFTPNGNTGSQVVSTYADAGLKNGDVTDGDASNGGTLAAAKTLTVATAGAVLAADGTFKFGVAGSAGGAITVVTGNQGASYAAVGGWASSMLTVTPVQTGNAAVASIVVSPGTVDQYDHDTYPDYLVSVLDASGAPVNGAVVKVAVNGSYNPAVVADKTTSLATWGATGKVDFVIPESGPGKHDSLTFFVDPPTTPTANKVDPSDPQRTIAATFTTPPATLSLTNSGLSVASNPVLASDAAQTLPVTITVRDNTSAKQPLSGVRVAIEATSSVPGAPAIPRVIGVTGADGTATLNVPLAAGEAADGTHVSLRGFISGSLAASSGDALASSLDVGFEKRRYFVSYNGVPTRAVPGMVAAVQAVAGSVVNVPLHIQDQFGDAGSNVTLGYSIVDHAGNTHSRGNAKPTSALITDANGNATITYTDQAKNGATKSDTDDIVIDPSSAFGYLDANGGITLHVSYLSSLSADGAKSSWGTYSQYGSGTESGTDPNAAASGGKPSYTTVVSADPAAVEAKASHLGYSVLLRSPDNINLIGQPVTFSAPGAILVDPNHLDANGNPTYGLGTLTVTTGQVGDAAVLVTSVKAGTVTLTATAGGFSHTFNPVAFDPDKGYNLAAVTAPSTIKPGTSVKYVYAASDEFGNPVYGNGPDNVNPNWTYAPGADGILGSADDGAPVPSLTFVASTGDATGPGAAGNPTAVGSNSEFAVTLSTVSNDSGQGTLVIRPGGAWQAADYAPAGAPSSLGSLLVAHTLPSTGISSDFTVENSTPTGPVAITVTVTGKQANKGKTDVLTITVGKAAAGARVTVTGGKKTVTGTVGSNGKVTVRVSDKTPARNNTYTIKVAATDATKAGQTKFTIK